MEPHLTDTPEMRPFTIMRTLCLVRNAISIDLHTSRTPEMWTPRYSVKWTIGLAYHHAYKLTLIVDTLATNL